MDDFNEITCWIEGDCYVIQYGIDDYGEIVEVLKHVDNDLDYEHLHSDQA